MATINITSFCSLVYASFVVASMIARRADGITAATTTGYLDSDCTEPIYSSSVFKPYGLTINDLGNFNECLAAGNTNYSTICDASTGEYGLNLYADTECVELVQSSTFSQNCSPVLFNATSTDRQLSYTVECSDEEPSVISPNIVNYLAEEYNDDGCDNPTGNTEILSLGYNGTCSQVAFGNAIWFLMECMADGSVISQYFTLGDDTCSGDVWTETQTAVGAFPTSCLISESSGLYYNATLFGTFETPAPFALPPAATGLTPAPSSNNDSGAMPTIITDAPSLVVIQETGAPTTEAPARTIMETPAPAASEEAVSPNTVAPATTTSGTVSPTVTETTVALDNTGAPNTSRAGAANGATRAKNTGVAAGAVAVICGLGLVVGRMRQ